MMQQQQTYFLELYRAGMRSASDIAKASLENVQRMHSQQIEAVRSALEDNVRSTRELSEVRSLDEMMALQTRVMAAQMERTADFWGRMWRSASESQVAMIGQVTQVGGQLGERMRDAERKPQQQERKSA